MDCQHPIFLPKVETLVGCGHCIPCQSNARRDMATRLHFERKASKTAYFITLTYNDYCVPRQEDTGFPTCSRADISAFLRQIRLAHRVRIGGRRYYRSPRWLVVVEYGPKTQRPHYHLLVFNAKWTHIKDARDAFAGYWGKGFVTVKPVTTKRIMYVGKYHFTNQLWDRSTDVVKPFRIFTKRGGGLGHQWLTKENIDYVKDQLSGRIRVAGAWRPLPKYYRERVGFTAAERVALRGNIEAAIEAKYASAIAELKRLGYDDPYAELRERERQAINQLRKKITKGLVI